MARKAKILGVVDDHTGRSWDVREERPTEHGFAVYLGWPQDRRRGQGGAGGPQVILTAELVAYLEEHRHGTSSVDLPLGDGTVKRLRRELGHHRYRDAQAWWAKRRQDLCTLTLEDFAARHGRTPGAVEWARLKLVGRQLRTAGWWQEPVIAEFLLSDRPTEAIGADLDLAPGSVRRLRWELRQRLGRGRKATGRAGSSVK